MSADNVPTTAQVHEFEISDTQFLLGAKIEKLDKQERRNLRKRSVRAWWWNAKRFRQYLDQKKNRARLDAIINCVPQHPDWDNQAFLRPNTTASDTKHNANDEGCFFTPDAMVDTESPKSNGTGNLFSVYEKRCFLVLLLPISMKDDFEEDRWFTAEEEKVLSAFRLRFGHLSSVELRLFRDDPISYVPTGMVAMKSVRTTYEDRLKRKLDALSDELRFHEEGLDECTNAAKSLRNSAFKKSRLLEETL